MPNLLRWLPRKATTQPTHEDMEFERCPPRRKRALTLPLSSASKSQTTVSQSSSPFFTRLPLELRMRIYEEMFRGQTLHLESKEPGYSKKRWGRGVKVPAPRIWSFECHEEQGEGLACWYSDGCVFDTHSYDPLPVEEEKSKWYVAKGKKEWKASKLAILFTCRQIYSESIDILYREISFSFLNDITLRLLPSLLPSHRLTSIAALDLKWTIQWTLDPLLCQHAKAYYDSLWTLLASMTGLRHLRVAISILPFEDNGQDLAEGWLAPLEKLRGLDLEVFEVFMPNSYWMALQSVVAGKQYRLLGVEDTRLRCCGCQM